MREPQRGQSMVPRSASSAPVSGASQPNAEVDALLDRVRSWAATQPDVHAVALVGSWARGDAGARSDVDLVLLVDEPAAYLRDGAWIDGLGARSIVRTKSWGVLTERRLLLPSGLELDVGVASVSWAATGPVDAGTRQVVSDGIRIVFDPERVLTDLIAATRR